MKCKECGFDKDRIKILKMELGVLSQKVSEAEIEYEATKKIMEKVKNIDTSSEKNTMLYRRLMKEELAEQLDALRLRIDMIQKISPESASILNKILNEYEESYRDFFKAIEDDGSKIDGFKYLVGLLGFVTAVIGMRKKIDDIVKVSSYSIRDTIKRLET